MATRRRKPPHVPLSAEDAGLLAEYTRRRDAYAAALDASNILHHRHQCPVCGFPTLATRGDYELCVICMWEDDGDDGWPTIVAPPNYISQQDARLHAAAMLRDFDRTHEIVGDIDDLVRSIKDFQARRERGAVAVDVDDFTRNLRSIVPTRPR